MKIQNNYIFLRKEKSKDGSVTEPNKDEKHDIRIDLHINLHALLSRIFDLKFEDWDSNLSFSHTIKFSLTIGKTTNDVIFEVYEVLSDCYFNINVSGKTEVECVKVLEHIDSEINNSEYIKKSKYIIIKSYDAISEFYCNKIFSKYAHFERLFRRLLFNIYVLNYGSDYYKRTISQDVINKAKGNIRANKQKDEQYLKEFFYSLDYSDLQNILFTPKWTSVEEDYKQTFLTNNKNLSELQDAELRNFIKDINAKSDWERLFKDKITSSSIEEDMEYIRKQRNKVAHSKIFTYKDYTESLNILNKLMGYVNKAIILTQDKDFWEKNINAFNASIKDISESFQKINLQMTETIQAFLNDILKPLQEAPFQLQKNLKSYFETTGNFKFNMLDADIQKDENSDVIKEEDNPLPTP